MTTSPEFSMKRVKIRIDVTHEQLLICNTLIEPLLAEYREYGMKKRPGDCEVEPAPLESGTERRRRHGKEGEHAQEHQLPQQFPPKATPQSRHSPAPCAAPKLAPNPAVALWDHHSPLVLEPRARTLSSSRTLRTVLRPAPPSALHNHSCAPPLPHLPLALFLHHHYHHAPWRLLHPLSPKPPRPTRSGRLFSAPSSSASCARKALSILVPASTTRRRTMECMDVQAVEHPFTSRPPSSTRAADGRLSTRESLVPSTRLAILMAVVWRSHAQPVEVTWATSSRARVSTHPLMQGTASTACH